MRDVIGDGLLIVLLAVQFALFVVAARDLFIGARDRRQFLVEELQASQFTLLGFSRGPLRAARAAGATAPPAATAFFSLSEEIMRRAAGPPRPLLRVNHGADVCSIAIGRCSTGRARHTLRAIQERVSHVGAEHEGAILAQPSLHTRAVGDRGGKIKLRRAALLLRGGVADGLDGVHHKLSGRADPIGPRVPRALIIVEALIDVRQSIENRGSVTLSREKRYVS